MVLSMSDFILYVQIDGEIMIISSLEEARDAILSYFMDSGFNENIVIVDSLTVEKPYGWIFFYNTKEYLETGDFLYALLGNGPLVIERKTGKIVALPSASSPEESIQQYEDRRNNTLRPYP